MKEKKNILVLTQWSYKDPLIQTYTLPYLHIIRKHLPEGSKIYLVTFEQEHQKISSVEKFELLHSLDKDGIQLINLKYSKFGFMSKIRWSLYSIRLMALIFTKRISFIHAWSTTAGTLGYILSLLSGRPLIVDSYEPHAEAMIENGTWSEKEFKFKLLFFFEKKLSRHAHTVISATEGMRDYALRKYGAQFSRFYVKPACVDLNEFNAKTKKDPELQKQLGLEGKIVCVYAGKFGGIYLTHEVFDFFHACEQEFGEKFRALILTNEKKEILCKWAVESRFDPAKMVVEFVPHNKVSRYIGLGDFGITPVKPVPTKRFCTPIKNGEYWALGLPVVITAGISDDSEIIEENNAGAVIHELNEAGYSRAASKIKNLLGENPETLANRIISLAGKYRSYQIAEDIYKKIYGSQA